MCGGGTSERPTMADDDAPEESGTTSEESGGEQSHGLTVDPVPTEEMAEDGDQVSPKDEDMAEQVAELQEMLDGVDPENIAALGCVVVTKEEFEYPDGEMADGFTYRVLNADLDGYDEVSDVLSSVMDFNSGLEAIDVAVETPSGGPLDGLLGGL